MRQYKEGFASIGQGTLKVLGLTTIATLLNKYFAQQVEGARQIKVGFQHLFGATPEQKLEKFFKSQISGITNEDHRLIYSTLLRNVYRSADQAASIGTDVPMDPKTHVRLTKQVLDKLVTMRLVGVQPMSGPVGLVYNLRCSEGNSVAPLQMLNQPVECRSRQYNQTWCLEQIHDLNTLHPEAVPAFETTLTESLALELDNEMLGTLYQVATKYGEFEECNGDSIGTAIIRTANAIAKATHRGTGNWVIVSSAALTQLATDSQFKYIDHDRDVVGLYQVGTINNSIAVYSASADTELAYDVLVGYKGVDRNQLGQSDTGVIWAPYITISMTNVSIDPNTFEPRIVPMTRHGIVADSQASHYYGCFNLKQ